MALISAKSDARCTQHVLAQEGQYVRPSRPLRPRCSDCRGWIGSNPSSCERCGIHYAEKRKEEKIRDKELRKRLRKADRQRRDDAHYAKHMKRVQDQIDYDNRQRARRLTREADKASGVSGGSTITKKLDGLCASFRSLGSHSSKTGEGRPVAASASGDDETGGKRCSIMEMVGAQESAVNSVTRTDKAGTGI
jgi:hypothetical protein